MLKEDVETINKRPKLNGLAPITLREAQGMLKTFGYIIDPNLDANDTQIGDKSEKSPISRESTERMDNRDYPLGSGHY